MKSDTALQLAGLLLVLVLVGTGLFRRRLPAHHLAKLALLWGAIIAGLWLLLHVLGLET